MYRYLVHVLRDNIIAWRLADEGHRERVFNVYNAERVETEGRIDRERDYANMETWYCKTLPDAEAMARILAGKVPGTAVYIAEVKAVAVGQAAPAVFSNVTEKGVVPR